MLAFFVIHIFKLDKIHKILQYKMIIFHLKMNKKNTNTGI